MKKLITLLIFLTIALTGCTPPVTQNCSELTPPQIFTRSHELPAGAALDLCGELTTFPAVELKESNIILFRETNSYEDHVLKTISTIPPYTITNIGIISKNYRLFSSSDNHPDFHHKEKDLYIWGGIYGELCGEKYELFAFSPKTNEFLATNENDICGTERLSFISSTGEYSGNDIQFVSSEPSEKNHPNPKTFSELCGPSQIYEENIDTFVQNFPNKINCYEIYWKTDENTAALGYFDLINDIFVQISKPTINSPENKSTVEGPIITISGSATPGYRVVAHNNYKDKELDCISTYGITDGNGIADTNGDFEFTLNNACNHDMQIFVSAVNEEEYDQETCIPKENISDTINFTISGELHGVCNM